MHCSSKQLLSTHHGAHHMPHMSHATCLVPQLLRFGFLLRCHFPRYVALQDQQGQWQASLRELRSSDSQPAAADLQQQLEQLLEQLLSLPDPLPALSNAAALAARTAGEAGTADSAMWRLMQATALSTQLPACNMQVFVSHKHCLPYQQLSYVCQYRHRLHCCRLLEYLFSF